MPIRIPKIVSLRSILPSTRSTFTATTKNNSISRSFLTSTSRNHATTPFKSTRPTLAEASTHVIPADKQDINVSQNKKCFLEIRIEI